MAFGFTLSKPFPITDKLYMTMGTWDGDVGGAVATGELDTGLGWVEALFLNTEDSAVGNGAVYDETVPGACDGGVATIVFDSGKNGSWMAFGRKR